MTMRIQEIHPASVHFPIALLPTALAVDTLGRLTGNRTLLETGKRGMALVAATAAISGIAGLLAQEASRFDRESHDILATHRTLNLGLILATGVMALRRSRRRSPSAAYLLGGAASIGVMTYSAYLGGHMVYEHGVGVNEAGGLEVSEAPRLLPDRVDRVLEVTKRHLRSGIRHAISDLARGEVVPWLTRRRQPSSGWGVQAPADEIVVGAD
jgi:uncharacterized membrane protein